MKSVVNLISKLGLAAGLICIMAITLSAQKKSNDPAAMKQKLNSLKIAFLTDRLQLTEGEAEKFWPMYRSYEEEKKGLKEDVVIENLKADISENEAEKALSNMIDIKTRELELQKKYITKFRTALPAKKVIDLYRAEKEFKTKMVHKIRDRQVRGRR